MRTVGVEEEFLLIRESSSWLAAAAQAVIPAADAASDGQFERELKNEQAELGSRPHESIDGLTQELRRRRAELAAAAERHGTRLVASGTSPVDEGATTTADRRYEQMTEMFGRTGRLELVCGMHVHVSVDSADEGVAVLDRIRDWLAVVLALSANSPFYDGEDTGYASYRSMLWGQWPTAGPADLFGDPAGYERARASLVSSGAALDDAMVYFDARLSARYPTVEVRVADVCADAADAGVIAAIVRGLVSTVAREWVDDVTAVPVRTDLLRAASWSAARWGTEQELVDVDTAHRVAAWNHIDRLVDRIAPSLRDTGDTDLVHAGLNEIRRRGTGARRQRRTYAETGSFTAVVDGLAQHAPRTWHR